MDCPVRIFCTWARDMMSAISVLSTLFRFSSLKQKRMQSVIGQPWKDMEVTRNSDYKHLQHLHPFIDYHNLSQMSSSSALSNIKSSISVVQPLQIRFIRPLLYGLKEPPLRDQRPQPELPVYSQLGS